MASPMSCVTKTTVLRSPGAFFPDAQYKPLQLGAGAYVQRAEGLVEQQRHGVHGQRAGDRRPLRHAAGELIG